MEAARRSRQAVAAVVAHDGAALLLTLGPLRGRTPGGRTPDTPRHASRPHPLPDHGPRTDPR